ncbi:MAG TPA: NAD-dependent epimerase/dehydratase family protein [Thermoanaerobaculia bacterium]|nr:NAD-dependent epimerase/dehydratase family protein [Thermoanaerobaculia bacterium]
MARRTAFLTGGTGFVGAHVARALGEEGWSVRALARRPEALAAEDLRDLSLESVAGDLSHASESALREGARGVEAIVHVAGLVKARSLEAYREVNAGGTVQLLRAAAQSAPDALFVLVSSQAAAGPARNGRPVEEGDPAAPVSWYGRSKLEAEEAVASEWKGPWIVLRPVVVYGAGDRGLLRLFAAARRGWVPVPAGRSRVQLIEAPRAARAIALCAGRPDLSGKTAFLGDPESVEISDLSAIIASLPQKPARRFPVPDAAVRALGFAASLQEAVTGRTLAFNADKAREILAGDWLCRPEVMQRHLSLPPPVPLDYGLKDTWDWYIRRGWLKL